MENVDVMLRSDISVRCAGKREIFDRYRHVKMGNACLNGDILCPVVANGTKTVHNARILDSSEEHEDIFFHATVPRKQTQSFFSFSHKHILI